MAGSRIKGITVEIGGDTTKLQTALKGVNSEIKNTQAQLKDVEKLLKLDPGNTELLTQKQKLLKDAIAETKEKLATLKTAAEQANEALARGDISQAQYDALQREIAETEAKLKDLESQASKSAVALEKIAATGTKLQGVGNTITGVGKSLAPLSAAAAAVGVAGVKAATDWESAFAGVKKTTDATEQEYEELAAGIQKMATETASSAEDIAAVAEAAGQLGISKEHLLEFTKTMVMLGDSTNLSADEAAVALARFLNITGESTGNVDRLGAAIVDLGNNFATDEASIVAMSTRLASAGTLAGLTSTDILALSTAMSSVGIQAEAGGTAMTQTLTAIEKAASDAANGSTAALDRIASVAGMSSAEFASAWERRPIEALQAFIAGLGSLDEKGESATLVLDELGMSGVRQSNMLKSLALASGVLSDAIDTSSTAYQNNTALTDEASKRYQTFASQVSQLKEAFKAVAVDIGNILIPILRNLMSVLQVVLNWWNNLSDGTKNFIVQIGSLIAILSPVLIIGGKIISGVGTVMTILPKLAGIVKTVKTAFGALNAVLAANPIMLIIAAIAALVAAFIYLWNNCEEFRQFWIDLWENIKAVVAAVGEWLSQAWQAMGEAITVAWNAICEFFTGLWESIKNIFMTVVTAISTFLTNTWNAISNTVTTVWTAISNTITTIVNAISTFITTAWNTIKTTVTTIANAIWTAITTAFNNMLSAITGTVSNIRGAIQNGFESAKNYILNLASQAYSWGRDIIQNIVNGIKSMISSVVSAVSNVASTIRSYLHFSVPDKGPLTDFEKWMPDFMHGMAEGIRKNRPLIEKAISGVADVMDFKNALPDMNANLTASIGGGISSGDYGEVKLSQPIMIDGKVITTIVSQIQYQRGKASLRNLGTV
jgi:phage tail tape measure protein, TP901 family, core region